MKNPTYEIPQWALETAIEGLQELVRRQTDDAAAFAKLDTPEARSLAQELLKQAKQARKAHEFYLHL